MPDINDLHKFYEANLPDYERKDLNDVNRFFLELAGLSNPKPLKTIFSNWKRFKAFVCHDWQGQHEQSPKKGKAIQAKPRGP